MLGSPLAMTLRSDQGFSWDLGVWEIVRGGGGIGAFFAEMCFWDMGEGRGVVGAGTIW